MGLLESEDLLALLVKMDCLVPPEILETQEDPL